MTADTTQLPDTSKMIVAVRVHEAKTDKLEMGQFARIEVEGYPDRQFSGKVTKIAVLADTQNRWLNPDLKEYETEITLDPTDITLKPGVTAYVEIVVETVENALAVPVQSHAQKLGVRDLSGFDTFGNRGGTQTLGYAFTALSNTFVTGFGVFDHLKDGLTVDHEIGLWASTGTLLATASVSPMRFGLCCGRTPMS